VKGAPDWQWRLPHQQKSDARYADIEAGYLQPIKLITPPVKPPKIFFTPVNPSKIFCRKARMGLLQFFHFLNPSKNFFRA